MASEQYRYVGPALFNLITMPDNVALCKSAGGLGWVRPLEVWIEVLHTWVRLDGSWVSGWDNGVHFGFRPSLLNRWKLRRAGRRWLRAKHPMALAILDATGQIA